MLVAHENNLGTVWVGSFIDEEVSEILNSPQNLHPVAIVPVGYPLSIPTTPPRVSAREAVVFK
ncbi:MAG: nitroreductase family protein, partial [Planctomycetes bacterium]|nr:nitroreductase family protein [Planctomycetota bacterium]